MNEQLCIVMNYLYRRVPIPGSIQWHMNYYRMGDTCGMRLPGFVEQEGDVDHLSIVLAVPCTATGEIDSDTQCEYENLADERFGQLRPGQELA